MTAVALNSVTTTDAAPTGSPHKISAQAGENQASVNFTMTCGAGNKITAWRLTVNGNRKTGRNLGSLGVVCGIDRCGAPGAKPLAASSPYAKTEVVTYAEVNDPVDGAKTVNVDAVSAEGWA